MLVTRLFRMAPLRTPWSLRLKLAITDWLQPGLGRLWDEMKHKHETVMRQAAAYEAQTATERQSAVGLAVYRSLEPRIRKLHADLLRELREEIRQEGMVNGTRRTE